MKTNQLPVCEAEPTKVARSDSPHYHLLTVAASAISWWEKHQYDIDHRSPAKAFLYQREPDFVTHAREIFLKFCN